MTKKFNLKKNQKVRSIVYGCIFLIIAVLKYIYIDQRKTDNIFSLFGLVLAIFCFIKPFRTRLETDTNKIIYDDGIISFHKIEFKDIAHVTLYDNHKLVVKTKDERNIIIDYQFEDSEEFISILYSRGIEIKSEIKNKK